MTTATIETLSDRATAAYRARVESEAKTARERDLEKRDVLRKWAEHFAEKVLALGDFPPGAIDVNTAESWAEFTYDGLTFRMADVHPDEGDFQFFLVRRCDRRGCAKRETCVPIDSLADLGEELSESYHVEGCPRLPFDEAGAR